MTATLKTRAQGAVIMMTNLKTPSVSRSPPQRQLSEEPPPLLLSVQRRIPITGFLLVFGYKRVNQSLNSRKQDTEATE
jgi:hypothetical protein